MKKSSSIEEFKAFAKELSQPRGNTGRTIVIPAGTCSQASGANDLIRIAKRELLGRGLVEVPMGMTIGEIINEIGGGPEDGIPIKAVQTGGPSGGCIPAEQFDLPVSFDSLTKAGSMMGSGGMIVMDQNTCMVDVAKYFMTFMKDESCGKCFVCRKGTQRLHVYLPGLPAPMHFQRAGEGDLRLLRQSERSLHREKTLRRHDVLHVALRSL
jgi:NADH:ubiquinone oxidoreductase subunit F (NADH-binding)